MSFSNLPEEIILNILLRIPIKSVFTCKCVCKSWLTLLETPEFTRSHHYKSPVPGLIVNQCTQESNVFKVFDIEHGPRCKRLIELDAKKIFFGNNIEEDPWTYLEGSINGLFCFRKENPEQYYICNPITREGIKLPTPPPKGSSVRIITHGFGVSRLSGQYKVVRMLEAYGPYRKLFWQVYTQSSSSWRSIANAPTGDEELFEITLYLKGTFLHGNLHWLVKNLKKPSWWISCFNLETEDFTEFRAVESNWFYEMGVLRDCLCLWCDGSSSQSEFVLYVMSCYEKKSCWDKVCVIRKSSPDLWPLKVFGGDGDDDVFMVLEEEEIYMSLYSSRTNKTTEKICLSPEYDDGYFETLLYNPSFASLRDFETNDISIMRF